MELAQLEQVSANETNPASTFAVCKAFGTKAKEGSGVATLTDCGWEFRARRTVNGQDGYWLVGPGYAQGTFFPDAQQIRPQR